jgi:hypothetical protein
VKAMVVDGLAPSTAELIYRYLVSVNRGAVEDRIISGSPCRGIELPKLEQPHVEPQPARSLLSSRRSVFRVWLDKMEDADPGNGYGIGRVPKTVRM